MLYDYFQIGTKIYFIYNDQHYVRDTSLPGAAQYYKNPITAKQYTAAYRQACKLKV